MTLRFSVSLEVGQALAQMEFDHTVVAPGCEEEDSWLTGVCCQPTGKRVRSNLREASTVSLNYPITPIAEPLIDPLQETF